MKKRLSGDTIKYIAIAAMLLDHIAWAFLPFESPLSQIFHILGRITAPTMCFFIAQGFIHTRSVGKYLLRLLIFALVSQFPWCVLHGQKITDFPLNMIFTLVFCLLAVLAEERIKEPPLRVIVVLLCSISTMKFDWCFFAVLWSAVFFRFRNEKRKMWLLFSLVSLSYLAYIFLSTLSGGAAASKSLFSSFFTLGTFLCVPLISSYNESAKPNKKSKYVFYVFYPAHMLLLGVIKNLMG